MIIFNTVIIRKKYLHLILAVTMIFTLTSCAYLPLSEPESGHEVITQDDLTPPQTVDEIIAEVESAENYSYTWDAENIDATVDEYIQGFIDSDEAITKDETFLEREAEYLREWLTTQISHEPTVTAQEAANIIGNALSSSYGYDKQNINIDLFLGEIFGRLVWGSYFHYDYTAEGVFIKVDATNAQVLELNFTADVTSLNSPDLYKPSECFVIVNDFGNNMYQGYWNKEHAEFESTMAKLEEDLKTAIANSSLTNGAQIIGIERKFFGTQSNEQLVQENLAFEVELDNGRKLRFTRLTESAPFVDYDFDGYPLKAYAVFDMEFFSLE